MCKPLYVGLTADHTELDEVAVTFRVLGAEGRLLTSHDLWRLALAKPAARIPEVTVTSIERLGEWRASAADLAAEMTREVLLRFNFEVALSDLRRITERILRREI